MASAVPVLAAARSVVVVVGAVSLSGRRGLLRERRGKTKFCRGPVLKINLGRRRSSCTRCAYGASETKSVEVDAPVCNLYELLGISQQVGLPQIKTAYRELARRYHPDVNPPSKRDECTKKFMQVQEAYEVLADPDSRADYDFRLRNPLSVQALASGLTYKSHDRRSGKSRRNSESWAEEVVDKQAWRAQWEAQVSNLKRDSGRKKKAGSWGARMQEKREQEAAAASQ